MARDPSRTWLAADNHRGHRQHYFGWDASLYDEIWWKPAIAGTFSRPGDGGHGTAHRGSPPLHGLAFDGHAAGLRPDRRPHTSWRLTRMPPEVDRWYREAAPIPGYVYDTAPPPIAYDAQGYVPVPEN